MKPTQQEIIELAREQGLYLDGINTAVPLYVLKQEELVSIVHLALERFGAGGGEPVYAFRRKGQDSFCTCDENRYLELSEKPNLFEVEIFYASPTDLRAEYLRGLEDAANVCDEVSLQANAAWNMAYRLQDQGRETGADECADAIRALKGKQ